MEQINLYKLLKYYFTHRIMIAGFVAAGLIAGFVYNSYIQVPSYKSDATLFVVSADQVAISKDSTIINNYIELIKSRRVLEPVIKDLNLDKDYEDIAKAVSVSNQKDTAIVKLSVSTGDSLKSRDIANATIGSFKKQIKDLYGTENIQVVDSASLAFKPYNVRKSMQLGLAAISGFTLSIIIIFFMYDYKLSNGTLEEEVKKTRSNSKAKSSRSARTIMHSVAGSIARLYARVKAWIASIFTKPKAKVAPKLTAKKPVKKTPAKKSAKTKAKKE